MTKMASPVQKGHWPSFGHCLAAWAQHQPDATAFTFWQNKTDEAVLTYGQLHQRAIATAAALSAKAPVGARVLLVHAPGLDFIADLFGCLYAGMVAVPVYPPDLARQATVTRIQTLAQAAQVSLIASPTALPLPFPTVLTGALPATDFEPFSASPETVALIQFTSGSTAEPKGVVLQHAQLLANSQAIERCFGHTQFSKGALWLPLYHDMGLIGGVFQAVYLGAMTALLSPLTFLKQPLRWLETIARHRATTAGAPNFAYEACVERIKEHQKEGLDLSSWELAFSGAEPVRADTLTRFSAAFESCGFRSSAFYPCYGMSETTLIIAGGPKGRGPRTLTVEPSALSAGLVVPADTGQTLVSVGQAVLQSEVIIVDPETTIVLPEGRLGEIWAQGPGVATGYFNDPARTRATFCAQTADGRGPYLRTGDLGFFWQGELYIAGRQKELIIVAGKNFYPPELERSLAQVLPQVKEIAAVSVDDGHGSEKVLLVLRAAEDLELAAQARQIIAENYEISAQVVFVGAALPKTSSGKLQRLEIRRRYLAGELI